MDIFSLILNLIQILMIPIGLLTGGIIERRHLRKLAAREAKLSSIMKSNSRHIPSNWVVRNASLVTGEAVIASDSYKRFACRLRAFFGGEMHAIETLMERGRREATVRMLEQAAAMGGNAVWNVRIETAAVGKGNNGRGMAVAEVYAYGTALCVEPKG